MIALILTVTLAVLISAFCSVCEAVLYSTPWSVIEQLRREGKKAGQIMFDLRLNVERPITAILLLNTVAATAGASLAGAAAVTYFDSDLIGVFTAAFTAAILILGEIIPKTVGVTYNQRLAPVLAKPFLVMVKTLAPFIWALGLITRLVRPKKKGPQTNEDDIRAVVSLTRKAGVIKPYEELAIQNILTLDSKTVSDIMTPRTVLFSLPVEMTVREAREARPVWPHSRIPVYQDDDPEQIVGIIYRRQVYETLANDQHETRLSAIMRPVQFVLDTLPLDRLLVKFLESRTHLFVALDEYGGVSGAVSLEDVLEEILGKEIVDETDQVADMRDLARVQREKLLAEAAETSK